MSESKSDRKVPPKPRDRSDTFLLDPALMGTPRRRKSPLDQELEAEDAMQARELRDLRVQELIERRKARIAKLRKEIEALESQSTRQEAVDEEPPAISLSMARQLANLPEEERMRVLETYAMVQGLGKARGDTILPLLVGYARANPGAKQNEMVEFAKSMTEQLKTGVELGKTISAPQQTSNNPTEILKVFMDLVSEGVRRPVEELVKQIQPQPSALEQILLDDRLFNRAKELGFFTRPQNTGRSDIDLEIEKLRGERELQIKKLELEMQKAMLEHQANEKRTETLINAIAPISTLFAGPVNQRMRQLGRQAAEHQKQGNMVRILCPCGYNGLISFEGDVPNRVKCPACGQELYVGEAPIGGPEEGNTET